MGEEDYIFKELTFNVIGAAMDVHTHLGNGFLEAIYHEALCMELRSRGIQYESEKPLEVIYKGAKLTKKYIADLVIEDSIIVELKTKAELTGVDEAQLLNYLKCTGLKLGLLINFGGKSLEWDRKILSSK